MAKVSATICGVRVEGMIVMPSRYSGFDIHAKRRFAVGTTIAYKGKQHLTDAEKAIFSDGKVYPITVQWPLQQGKEATVRMAKPVNFDPSEHQLQIFDTILTIEDHIEIMAYAGSGKTTTLVWIVQELVKRGILPKNVIYLAFNKSIQEELADRLFGTGCDAKTTHAFGLAALKSCFGNILKPDKRRTGDLFLQVVCDDNALSYDCECFKQARKFDEYAMRNAVLELVSYIKNWAIVPTLIPNDNRVVFGESSDDRLVFSEDQLKRIDELVSMYEIEFPVEFTRSNLIAFACRVVAKSFPKAGCGLALCDYDDMLYLPIALDLPLPKFQLVLTDESQDFNACQVQMLNKMCKDGARVIFVGDPNQALYHFRGADCHAFERIAEMLEGNCRNLTRHNLPKSYRSAKRIIKRAQKWVPELQGHREEWGTVDSVSFGKAMERVNNDCRDIALPDGIDGATRELKECNFAFLCRTNLPLIVTAYQLIAQGKRVAIVGRSQIGAPLKRIINDLCGTDPHHPDYTDQISDIRNENGIVVMGGFLTRLFLHYTTQVAKLESEGYEKKLEKLQQDVECLEIIATRVSDDRVSSMLKEIDHLFSDDPEPGVIQLSTIHRAKGLEWNVVFILRPDLLPHPSATTEEELQQEENACYVGATRAKDRLHYVEDWPFGGQSKDLAFEQPEEVMDYPEQPVAEPQPVVQTSLLFEKESFVDDGEPF